MSDICWLWMRMLLELVDTTPLASCLEIPIQLYCMFLLQGGDGHLWEDGHLTKNDTKNVESNYDRLSFAGTYGVVRTHQFTSSLHNSGKPWTNWMQNTNYITTIGCSTHNNFHTNQLSLLIKFAFCTKLFWLMLGILGFDAEILIKSRFRKL